MIDYATLLMVETLSVCLKIGLKLYWDISWSELALAHLEPSLSYSAIGLDCRGLPMMH